MSPSPPIFSKKQAVLVAGLCASFVIFSGCSAILGWALDLPRLTDWTNQGISMFTNAAICALLSGCALALLIKPVREDHRIAARVLAGLVIAIAGLTLFEHVTGVDLGIDTLLFQRDWGQTASASPMRMGVPASTAYLISGSSLILATYDSRRRRLAAKLAIVTMAIAMLSLTGYWFGANQLFGVAKYTGIALQTSMGVAAMSIGLMAIVPEHGVVAALRRDDAGGAMLRRLIVPIIIVPLFLGWLRVLGQQQGLYDMEFGTALRTLCEVALFSGLLWWTANSISWHSESATSAQARLVAIIESTDDAIVSKSLEGIIETWNHGAEEVFGYQPEEAIGQHISLIIPPDRLSEETEIIRKLRRGERIEHFETIRRRKDGSLIFVSITVSPIRNAAGQVVGASKIARDISDKQRAEARLRAIIEATPECIKIVAPDGALEFINQAGLGMIESASETAVQGACVYNLIAPEHRAEWITRHERICAGERLSWEFEIIGLLGTRRWMESHAVPLPLPDGRVGQMSVTREITSRKQLEHEREALLQSERNARSDSERASRLKDEFLATLSHELRTPLNAILGWSQILNMTSDKEDLDQGLEAIQRNARVQAQLIEDLLDMNRIISGKMRLNVQPTDLAPVIQGAIESVTPAAAAKDIKIRQVLDPHASAVSGDPTRLQQIIWNLLTNAIKFTPKGGKVDIVLERVNSHLEVTISDTGIGISPEHLPIIFERFRQVDSSSTRVHGGLGLGLSIVKQLIELHGGTIRAKSAGEGRGSTFILTFPLSPVRAGDDRTHPETPKTGFDVGKLDLAGIRVLVVDDEPDSRVLVERVLAQCGALVITADSATQGMEKLREFKPHVLVSDIGMPITDGYQFIRDVRSLEEAQGGRTPAVALTAFARSEDRMRAMLAGYQVHVSKPIEPQELAVTVRSLSRDVKPSVN
jgi:PAS domain S-box-containing protein